MTIFELYDLLKKAVSFSGDGKCFFVDDDGDRWTVNRIVLKTDLLTGLVELVLSGEEAEED